MTHMYIIWSVVVGVALLIEFLTQDLITTWFAGGGLVALILTACNVPEQWQVLTFFLVAFVLLLSLRPIVKKFINFKTVPTNADAFIGQKFKLLNDAVDGRSEIKINDIIWTAVFDDRNINMGNGTLVEVTGVSGNKIKIKKAEEDKK